MNAPRALRDVLAERAARAPSALDLDEVLAAARIRAGERARRTRNLRAAGGGAFGIAAAVALIVAFVPTGGEGDQSGGGPTASASPPVSSGTVLPATSSAAAASRAAAARAARRAAASRAAAARAPQLVTVAAAPAGAEVSIRLVPQGWSYLGYQGPTTYYGPPSAGKTPGDFTNKIVVDVHARITPDGAHPLTVAGHPASYGESGGVQTVDIVVSKTIDIDVQIWSNAHTTKQQALRIAGTITVRSTKVTSSG